MKRCTTHGRWYISTLPGAPVVCGKCGTYRFRIAMENRSMDVIDKGNGNFIYRVSTKNKYWKGNPTL